MFSKLGKYAIKKQEGYREGKELGTVDKSWK
jgi:hypothetical protein